MSRRACKLLLFLPATAQIRAFSVLQLSPPAHQNRPETLPGSSAWLLWSDGARTHDSLWACARAQLDDSRDIINAAGESIKHYVGIMRLCSPALFAPLSRPPRS